MTTRRGILAAAMAVAPAAASALAQRTGASSEGRLDEGTTAEKPNLVIIQLDDMRDEDWMALGRTRKVLEDGTWFRNYFINFPQCAPSRATLLTGMYAHNHRVYAGSTLGSFKGYMASMLDKVSLGAVLQDAGYRTAMIGTFINGYVMKSPRPAGWDRWAAVEVRRHFRADLNLDGKVVRMKKTDYSATVLADCADQFIRETPIEQPLLLYFNPSEPHEPVQPLSKHRKRFRNQRVIRDLAFNEADVSDKPSHVSTLPLLSSLEVEGIDELHRGRLQMLLSIDGIIPRLMSVLEQTGRLGNTYIFVLSDNGFMMGTHRLIEKSVPYDQAVRVSMLAWGPRFLPETRDMLATNADIAPTCAALAGTLMPSPDGISLLDGQLRDYIPILCHNVGSMSASGTGLRSSSLAYFEYLNGDREYYDLRNDPLELSNLLPPESPADPDPPLGLPRPSELAARLAELRVCSGSGCA